MIKGKLKTKSGEQDVDVLLIKQRYFYTKGEFIVMSKELAELLSSNVADKLTGLDFRLLMALIKRADANNRIRLFKQTILAEELGSNQASISRSLARLIVNDIIEPDDFGYKFNKRYIYTGGKDGKIEEITDEL
jgi:DNA-binding MarR family transcriptional regulator